jgi:ubiquinone/menaquinone biosynthesis C-methylase UbiE
MRVSIGNPGIPVKERWIKAVLLENLTPEGTGVNLIFRIGKNFKSEGEMPELFDVWPDEYERWFQTPIGRLVRKVEMDLVLDLLKPSPGERILDAGCGTGIFTTEILNRETRVAGLDLSLPMLRRANSKEYAYLELLQGDMRHLPFPEGSFDKTVSITALEFIVNGKQAIDELFRVTKKGGTIVVATLNRLSPWAVPREEKGKKGHPLFSRVVFRTPEEMAALTSRAGILRTAVHFEKEEDPRRALEVEEAGKKKRLLTGAFLAVRWEKP